MELLFSKAIVRPQGKQGTEHREPNSKSHSKCPDILTFKGPSEHLIALPTVSQPTKTILHFIYPFSIPTCQKSSERSREKVPSVGKFSQLFYKGCLIDTSLLLRSGDILCKQLSQREQIPQYLC